MRYKVGVQVPWLTNWGTKWKVNYGDVDNEWISTVPDYGFEIGEGVKMRVEIFFEASTNNSSGL